VVFGRTVLCVDGSRFSQCEPRSPVARIQISTDLAPGHGETNIKERVKPFNRRVISSRNLESVPIWYSFGTLNHVLGHVSTFTCKTIALQIDDLSLDLQRASFATVGKHTRVHHVRIQRLSIQPPLHLHSAT